jgi:CheY-like chemotaxis protein
VLHHETHLGGKTIHPNLIRDMADKKFKTVLSIDDNDMDGALLQRAFHRAKVHVTFRSVTKGMVAFCYLSGEGIYADREHYPVPDLVLLDVNMPGISGWDVLRWVRKHPPLKDLQVIMLSSTEMAADAETARNLGASDYLKKPRTFQELIVLVQKIHNEWLTASRADENTSASVQVAAVQPQGSEKVSTSVPHLPSPTV